MMRLPSLWPGLFRRRTPSDAGRELAFKRIADDRERVRRRTQQMREELNLGRDPRLA